MNFRNCFTSCFAWILFLLIAGNVFAQEGYQPVDYSSFLFTSSLPNDSKFSEPRKWSSKSGEHSFEGKVLSTNGKQVVISGVGRPISLIRLSEEDQAYALQFLSRIESDFKRREEACIYAEEALQLMKAYRTQGFLAEAESVFFEEKIEVLEKHALRKCVLFPNAYVPFDQLAQMEVDASILLKQWPANAVSILAANSQKNLFSDLKKAEEMDHTAIESLILHGLFLELHNGDLKSAQKRFSTAIDIGEKYSRLSPKIRHNLAVARNNLAVSYVKSNKIGKAMKVWDDCFQAGGAFGEASVERNVVRTAQLVKRPHSGIDGAAGLVRQVGSLAGGIGYSSSPSARWTFLLPVDISDKPYSRVDFMVVPRFSLISDGTIQDVRCVRCNGSGTLKCNNKLCQNGRIFEDIWGQRTRVVRGQVVPTTGRVVIRRDVHRCPTCGGDDIIDCPACDNGVQK